MSDIAEPNRDSAAVIAAIERSLRVIRDERYGVDSTPRAEEMRQRVKQAEGELREIFNHAREQLQAVAPDADLRSTRESLILSKNDAKLQVSIWRDMPQPGGGDTIILAGAVEITNWRFSGQASRRSQAAMARRRQAAHGGSGAMQIAANVVYEITRDRTGWQQYSFRRRSVPVPPESLTYGLGRDAFYRRLQQDRERSAEPNPGQEPDRLTSCKLTSAKVLELFLKAVNLEPPHNLQHPTAKP